MVASLGTWSPFCSRGMQSRDQHQPWPPRGPGGGQKSRLPSSHRENLHGNLHIFPARNKSGCPGRLTPHRSAPHSNAPGSFGGGQENRWAQTPGLVMKQPVEAHPKHVRPHATELCLPMELPQNHKPPSANIHTCPTEKCPHPGRVGLELHFISPVTFFCSTQRGQLGKQQALRVRNKTHRRKKPVLALKLLIHNLSFWH